MIRNAAPDLVGVQGDRLVVVAHMGTQNTLPPISVGKAFSTAGTVLNVGDWDRDGYGDVITRPTGSGTLELRRGLAGGKLAAPVSIATGFSGVSLLTAVGDTTGDGWPDLMGQPKGSALRIYPGNGVNGLRASYVAHSAVSATAQLGAGRWDSDGAPDNLFRVDNRLKVLRGNGPGGLTGSSTTVPSLDLTRYDWVLSPGDVNRDGRADLVVREKATGYLWLLAGDHAAATRPAGSSPRGTAATTWPADPSSAVARSSSRRRSQAAGSAFRTQTVEPPRTSGCTNVASPSGLTGFAVVISRSPSASGRTSYDGVSRVAWPVPGSASSSAPGGSHGQERVGLRPDLDAEVVDVRAAAGRGSARPAAPGRRRPPGASAACAAYSSRPSGPHTKASASSSSTRVRPTFHAAPRKTGPSQCVGRSMRIRSPRVRSSSSTNREEVFATQLAYVATESSTRSPVASS